MTPAECFRRGGVFDDAQPRGVTVLGSASKNAGRPRPVRPSAAVPTPWSTATRFLAGQTRSRGFLKGAAAVDAAPSVRGFEDAAAGIEAAARAGMRSVGVGGGASLSAATMRLETFAGFTFEQLAMKIDRD